MEMFKYKEGDRVIYKNPHNKEQCLSGIVLYIFANKSYLNYKVKFNTQTDYYNENDLEIDILYYRNLKLDDLLQ